MDTNDDSSTMRAHWRRSGTGWTGKVFSLTAIGEPRAPVGARGRGRHTGGGNYLRTGNEKMLGSGFFLRATVDDASPEFGSHNVDVTCSYLTLGSIASKMPVSRAPQSSNHDQATTIMSINTLTTK
jgi:hypothetical protein